MAAGIGLPLEDNSKTMDAAMGLPDSPILANVNGKL